MKNQSNEIVTSDDEAIKAFVSTYVKKISVKRKQVIFEEINKEFDPTVTGNKNLHLGSYEALSTKWTNNLKTIYSFTNKNGKIENYLFYQKALTVLSNANNYNIKTIVLDRDSAYYKFNNQIFYSINEIYEYILNSSNENKEENNEKK